MSISLFPHNQKAYEALLDVLEMEHRGCVIHPTGTGKSFIGFQYCEAHPHQAVLWLSSPDYFEALRRKVENAEGQEKAFR